jgi:hypothetical protein
MRRVIVVKPDVKVPKIAEMLGVYALDQRFRRDAFRRCAKHDRSSMRVIGAYIVALMPLHLLETDPDIRLDVFNKMA